MALINCPECGTEVSDKALNCPKCAYPFQKPSNSDISQTEEKETKKSLKNETTKWWHVSWITYLSIGLLFFLPFCDISCSGRKIVSFTGIVLATGAQISPSFLETEIGESKEVPANLWAILAFTSVLLGFLVSLTAYRTNILSGLLGIACAFSLIILQVTINQQINEIEIGLFSATYTVAYWVVLIAAIGVGILNFMTAQYANYSQNQTIALLIKTIVVFGIFFFIIVNFDPTAPFQFRPMLNSTSSESSGFSGGSTAKEMEEYRIADSIRIADSLAMDYAEKQRISDSINNASSGD
jgi:hypothetical protein